MKAERTTLQADLYTHLLADAEAWLFGYEGQDAVMGQCRQCGHSDSLHLSGQTCTEPRDGEDDPWCECLGIDDLTDGILIDPSSVGFDAARGGG